MATKSTAPVQRDQVYCHECHNDWFRDEHGLVCPNEMCRSDFVEIIESGSDPRRAPDLESDEDESDDEHDHSHGFPQLAHHQHLHQHHQHQHQYIHNAAGFGPFMPFGASIGGAPGATETVVRAEGPNFRYITRTVFHSPHGGAHAHEDELIADLFSTMLRNIVGDNYSRPGGANREGDHPMEGGDPQHAQPHGQGPRLNPRDADAPQAGDAMPPVPDIQTFLNSLFGPVNGERMSPLVSRFFNGSPGGGDDYVYSQAELDRIISRLMEQHQGNAPPPAQKEDIESLPRISVTQAMVDDGVDCAVCKDDLLLGIEVAVLPCKHSYHFDCVSKWLVEHDTCPICRNPITPPEKRQNQQQANNQRQPSSPGGNGSGSGGISGGIGGPIPGGFSLVNILGAGLPQTRPRGSGSEHQNQDTQNHPNRFHSPLASGRTEGFPGSFPHDNDEENRNQDQDHDQDQQNQSNDGGNANGHRSANSFANLFRRRNS